MGTSDLFLPRKYNHKKTQTEYYPDTGTLYLEVMGSSVVTALKGLGIPTLLTSVT